MTIFGADISFSVSEFLLKILNGVVLLEDANEKLFNLFGIKKFFENCNEIEDLKKALMSSSQSNSAPDRTEYGDFQTSHDLAYETTTFLKSKGISPQIIIEPTCGKGNFIIAALNTFCHVDEVIGVEIYKPYIWECKFNIIEFFLRNPEAHRPSINIFHFNVFDFNFHEISKSINGKKLLIIGNPPWITNSKLGCLNSTNLPRKVNLKKHNGIDAITGKGNFDIAEYITELLIKEFQVHQANIALLVKNSVIKNIIYEQKTNKHQISNFEKYTIDSHKEFNVSVEASLFFLKLGSPAEFNCIEYNFYNKEDQLKRFGWVEDKFVSNIDKYEKNEPFDGVSPYIWRQGVKHDCTKVMELDKLNGYFLNKLGEKVELEDGLVYGFLKSSDLKNTIASKARKYTIITQAKIGQETNYIKDSYPKTYDYLISHKNFFDSRKSSIYNNKPLFSIFGIGDYSFMPYKIAISGLYKTFHFTLVLPQENKPVMLDDTCYFLGFVNLEFAVYTLILLNNQRVLNLLESITFSDAKRTFTKETLMRIDMDSISKAIPLSELADLLSNINITYNLNVSLDCWNDYQKNLKPIEDKQLRLFA